MVNLENATKNLTDFSSRPFSTTKPLTLYSVLAFIGVYGLLISIANGLVLFLYHRCRSLRNCTNLFLFSLAASDLCAGAIGVPLIVAATVANNRGVAIAMDITQRFLSVSTILHLVGASSERYIKIAIPLKYPLLVTKRRVIHSLAIIWIFSCSVSTAQLAWIRSDARRIDFAYSLTCLVLFVLVPVVVMIVLYTYMFKILRETLRKDHRASRKRKRRQKEKQATVVYLCMIISFFVGWSSYFFASLFDDVGNPNLRFPLWLDVTLLFLKLSTAFINPMLYTFFKKDFQNAIKLFFCCRKT